MLTSTRRRAAQRGLSIVEMMVGVTIGLLVVAGATMVVSTQLLDNRQLMVETQVQQDLRAAADIITRDLRRAGYTSNPQNGVWYKGTAQVACNRFGGDFTSCIMPSMRYRSRNLFASGSR